MADGNAAGTDIRRTSQYNETDSTEHRAVPYAFPAPKYNRVVCPVRHNGSMQSADDVAAAVGRNVRALRQQRGLTIDTLAAASGVSRGTVIQVETARGNPSIATLCSLAAALRVGVASLV